MDVSIFQHPQLAATPPPYPLNSLIQSKSKKIKVSPDQNQNIFIYKDNKVRLLKTSELFDRSVPIFSDVFRSFLTQETGILDIPMVAQG